VTELADWGIPPWLPERVARRCIREDALEAKAAREAEVTRGELAEARRAEVIAAYVSERHALGDTVDLLALARGDSPGRSINEILTAAVAASAREDLVSDTKLRRDGHGVPALVHVEVGEPRILTGAARSSVGQRIFNRERHWRDWQAAKKAADAARRAVEAEHEHGLPGGVTFRRRSESAAGSERASGPATGASGVRIRGGGHVIGIQ
jgi:hypothetical protein